MYYSKYYYIGPVLWLFIIMDWSDENYIAIIFSMLWNNFSGIYTTPPPYQPGQAWHAFLSTPRQLVFDK